MGTINVGLLSGVSGALVVDAQGQIRRLAEGETLRAGDVVVSVDNSSGSEPAINARYYEDETVNRVVDTDDAIAQVIRAVEEGFDPTADLGEEFDTASGETDGSSLVNSGTITRTGAEVQATTHFETDGLESQGLSETQSLELIDIIAFALVSGVSDVIEFEEDVPIETGGNLITDDPEVTFIADEGEGDNGYGDFVINEDGTWTFVANSPFNELADGEQIQDSFTVETSDGTEQVVTVTIIGTDDAAVATTGSGSVTEDVDVSLEGNLLETSGQISISDVDSETPTFEPNGVFNPVGSTNGSALGVLTISPDGAWNYEVNNDLVQFLDDDESVVEVYTVTATDGTTSEVTITINGADDPSEITVGEGDSDMGEVTEDVDVSLDNELTTSGTLTITDVDTSDDPAFEPNGTFNPTGSTNGSALGMLTITPDGAWTYVVNNDLVQYLDDDESVVEVYTVTATDGTTSEVTITINGADDPSEITVGEGDSDMGEVTEDVDVSLDNELTTSGTLTITDVDTSDDPAFEPNGTFNPTGSTNGSALGTLTITPEGEWTYVVNNDLVQYLDDDESVVEVYTVTATDGTTSEVTITINGADDPSEITVGEGDSDMGEVTEDVDVSLDNELTTSGTLTITDVDTSDDPAFEPNGTFNPIGSTNGSALGMLTITPEGAWTYVVNNDLVQYLDDDESVVEVYTVTATDGTTSEVTITINGADDPSEITVGEGDSDMGEVTEDVDVSLDNELTTSGTLTITDVDTSDDPAFEPNGTFNPTGSTNGSALGMLTITPDGAWTYVVNNDLVQYLDDDESVVEVYTVTATDGTTSEVTITINGADDPSEITVGEGDSDMGEVTEDVDVSLDNELTTSGTLTITDVDTSDDPAFEPNGTFNPIGSTNGSALGTLTITPDGAWTYVVNNDLVQYLDDDESVVEVYTVTATDGTTSEVTITINGADDPSEITVGEGDSDMGEVTEDVDVSLDNELTTSGTLTITDVDTSDDPAFEPNGTFNPIGSTNGSALGVLTITPEGAWTYVVNNDLVQYLDDDESVVEVYTVTATDGTTSEVTITINGADDPSEITVGEGDSDMGEVTEDVDVTQDNELTASGTLTITDVDTSDTPAFLPNGTFNSVGSTLAMAMGMLTITPDGAWTYTLDNSAIQYLNDDDTIIENYIVSSTDGVTHEIQITINGANDAPVAESFVVVDNDNTVIPIIFDSDSEGIPDYISDLEDDYDDIPLNIRIVDLPSSGTLLYTDENGVSREVTQDDIDNETLFVPNNISFVAGPGEEFELGYSGSSDDFPELVDGFYNWGEEVSPTERLITLSNGKTITISIEDNNDKPLKQYQGEQPHVGYGIGDTDGRGMNMQETLIVDLTDNPLDTVTFGLDGMGAEFNTNSNVYIEVVYTFLDGTQHTEQYQKDEGDVGNEQILYEFSYSSPSNPIVSMELSSTGGNWELRYIQGNEVVTEDATFDYVAVDSNGAESSVETVTLDIEEPQAYNVISAENDEPLVADYGNDMLIGNAEDNIFAWLDDALDNGTDVIKDFELYSDGSGDLIDLSDLLEDPQDGDQMEALLSMIDVSINGDDVELSIPLEGGSDAQTIVIQDVAPELGMSIDINDDLAVLGELIKNDAA
ncbi:VCBS domain-containing protein [Vibrio fortis]|uniref:VCBS domain-containing protein n=1 Tax=Vibrio fortis TaxID=212667 RepID=UPI003EB77801